MASASKTGTPQKVSPPPPHPNLPPSNLFSTFPDKKAAMKILQAADAGDLRSLKSKLFKIGQLWIIRLSFRNNFTYILWFKFKFT